MSRATAVQCHAFGVRRSRETRHVEQWTIINASRETHPFHIHTDAFQVMSINGVKQPYTGDSGHRARTVRAGGQPGLVVIRLRPEDFTGRIMFQCHIAAHEDNGMMSFLNVVGPHRSSAQP